MSTQAVSRPAERFRPAAPPRQALFRRPERSLGRAVRGPSPCGGVRIGTFLPNLGPAATPENLVTVADEAEKHGLDSAWVTDRLLMATQPSAPFLGSADGVYPDAYRYSLDPLAVLAYLARATRNIRLGTSILNINYFNPFVVGRTLTTLDVLSHGRLTLGVGIGWQPDEFAAAGVELKTRGRRADEFIQALMCIWTENPAAFKGEFFTLPESSVLPKPVQRPHPPILVGVNSRAGVARAVRFNAGIHPVNPTPERLAELVGLFTSLRDEAGLSDEAPPEIVVRIEYSVSDTPLSSDRPMFRGSREQLREDVERILEVGVTELIFDPTYHVETLDGFLSQLDFCAEFKSSV